MDQTILMKHNRKIRKKRPLIPDENLCEIFQTETLLEVSLSRGRCANDARGACIMCDYGAAGKNQDISFYIKEMKDALDNCNARTNCLMICTNGSIFDENQIDSQLLEQAIDLAAQCKIPHIEFETHYLDVTREKLHLLQKKLQNKKIIIALGLETLNQTYQDYIILKNIDLEKFKDTITLIKEYEFQIELNIMLGMPFLSTYEQFEDTCRSLRWAFQNQCRPVLFPMNIKPYTLLMEMYKTGYYEPISHWLLLLVLNILTEEQLSQIVITWYGNRLEDYGSAELHPILPICCEKCRPALEKFYNDFTASDSGRERKRILNAALAIHKCDCKDNIERKIKDKHAPGFNVRYNDYLSYLSRIDK